MRRPLDCDFFLGEEEPNESGDEDWLRVFPGPRGIVIADARVRLEAGNRVRHGEAYRTPSGIEFVFYGEDDDPARTAGRMLEMRFVVKSVRHDADMRYSLRQERVPGGAEA